MGTQDDFFEALGPTPAPPHDSPGFFTLSANIYRGADVAGKQFGARGTGTDTGAPGVIGQAGLAADGVQGFGGVGGNGVAGFGGVNGVAGYGGTTQGSSVVGTGVSGLGGANEGAQGGLGVQGVGGSGPNVTGGIGVLGFGGGATAAAPKDNAIGVCGIAGFSRTLNADGVYGIGGGVYSGVVGFGDPAPPPDSGNGTGVFGVGGFPSGPGVRGYGYGRDQTYRLPLGQSVSGNAIGVFGQGGSPDGDGVYGVGSGSGYGGDFEGGMGLAPLLLRPSNHSGHPTTGNHLMGELYVDKDGSLWYCKRGGAPGTWVKLA